MGLIALDNK